MRIERALNRVAFVHCTLYCERMGKAAVLLIFIMICICGWLSFLYYDASSLLTERTRELQKQLQGLRIDRDDLANQVTAANGKKLQITHELEAQKDEVKVKKAEIKKLNERMDTLMHEKEEAIQGKLTSDRKLRSATDELDKMKDTVDKVQEMAQHSEDELEELKGNHDDVSTKLKGCLHENEELKRQLQSYEKSQEAYRAHAQPPVQQPQDTVEKLVEPEDTVDDVMHKFEEQ